MWKWPAFAVVLLLLVLAIGVLLFRGRPGPPPTGGERGSAPPAAASAAPSTDAPPPPPERILLPPMGPPPYVPAEARRAADPAPIAEAQRPGSAASPSTTEASGTAEPSIEDEPPRERHTWPSDADGIRGAVRESLPDLKHCYEEWQKTSPELRGKVKIGFTISSKLDADAGSRPDAIVSSVRIGESELDHVFMEGCVKSVFAELRFEPPTDGEMSVTYPIQFDNVEPPAK